MNKQRILTAIAALFSLLIVFGGWFLTNELLNRQHLHLINTVHSIDVNQSPEAEPGIEPKVTLNSQQMANILKVWHASQTKYYHDPYDGQLTMEEAIKAANAGLSYFFDNNILPKGYLESDFTQTSAFLYDVQAITPVPIRENPDPAYSFWSVSMSNREASVKLTLNAQTGKIWMADFSSSAQNVNFNATKALAVLEHYEAYLGLSGGSGLRSGEAYASKNYDNNQIGITAYKRAGESGNYGSLHFSLTLTR